MNAGPLVSQAQPTHSRLKDFAYVIFIFLLAILLGALHSYHVSTMFENSRHFSHLSPLEREMSMKTELGMYYSYYKVIVESKTFSQGIRKVMNDKLVEHPDVVNSLKRFNIYPEVAAAFLYHIYSHYCNVYNIENKQCWSVKRNEHLPEVISCEGLGEPIYFYLNFIWILAGLTVSLLFIYSLNLCKNVYGAILAVLFYFYNHSEATRVQWSPPLRENFAFPFILLNAMGVTYFIRRMTFKPLEISVLPVFLTAVSGCICLLSWQFSQFVLMSQLIILFIMEQVRFITRGLFFLLLSGHALCIYLAVMIMQGNSLLINSLYLAMTCSFIINLQFWDNVPIRLVKINTIYNHVFYVVFNMLIVIFLTIILKFKFMSLLGSEDDSHIMHLLKSKFTSFKNFHTMLYTCSSEFDFLPASSVWNLTSTLLLPSALLGVLLFVSHRMYDCDLIEFPKLKSKKLKKPKSTESVLSKNETKAAASDQSSRPKNVKKSPKPATSKLISDVDKQPEIDDLYMQYITFNVEPEVIFNIFQLFAFFGMAVMIMRLKFFLTPYLCLIASLGTATKYYQRFINVNSRLFLSVALIFAVVCMSFKGIPNLVSQRSVIGEFSNEPLEDLLTWIKDNTEQTAAFAGPMPLTAAVMLSAQRPIVNHPHYEDANLRARTMTVYSMFSRQPSKDLYLKLTKLKVTYLIIDRLWCFHKSTNGCTMLDIWDNEEPHLKNSPPLCHQLFHESSVPHFHRIFSNLQYVVLKLHHNAVNIKIKKYDKFSM